LTLTRKNKEKVIEIKWEKASSQSSPSKEYELKDFDGFKTAVIAAFLATQNTNAMINDAKELSKESKTVFYCYYDSICYIFSPIHHRNLGKQQRH
jgi:hypothetical protein